MQNAFGSRTIDRSTNQFLGEGAHKHTTSIQAGLATCTDGTVVDLLKIQALCNTEFQESGAKEFMSAADELSKLTGLWKGPHGDWSPNSDAHGTTLVDVNNERGRVGEQTVNAHPALKIIQDVVHNFDGAGIFSIGANAALAAMAPHWASHLAEGHAPRIISEDLDELKQRIEIMRAEIMTRIISQACQPRSSAIYEAGSDDSGWNSKVTHSDGKYMVTVYDADGDIRSDKGMSTNDIKAAIAHADQAVSTVEYEMPKSESPGN